MRIYLILLFGAAIIVSALLGQDPEILYSKANNKMKTGELELADSLLKESKEIFQDLIIAAHNDAKSKLKKKTSEEISKVTGGINLPPGFKLPF